MGGMSGLAESGWGGALHSGSNSTRPSSSRAGCLARPWQCALPLPFPIGRPPLCTRRPRPHRTCGVCACMCEGACVCACVRACVCACVCACVRACVHVCVRACVQEQNVVSLRGAWLRVRASQVCRERRGLGRRRPLRARGPGAGGRRLRLGCIRLGQLERHRRRSRRPLSRRSCQVRCARRRRMLTCEAYTLNDPGVS